MKDEFLMHGDYNIIVVDWSGGNKPPYYQATSNTRVVGAEIAVLIEALEVSKRKNGVCSPLDFFIIVFGKYKGLYRFATTYFYLMSRKS